MQVKGFDALKLGDELLGVRFYLKDATFDISKEALEDAGILSIKLSGTLYLRQEGDSFITYDEAKSGERVKDISANKNKVISLVDHLKNCNCYARVFTFAKGVGRRNR